MENKPNQEEIKEAHQEPQEQKRNNLEGVNGTKRIQTYLITIGSAILFLVLIGLFVKNIMQKEKIEEVKEVVAPIVKALEKKEIVTPDKTDNFFMGEPPAQNQNVTNSNPFEFQNNSNTFEPLPKKINLTGKIIKGDSNPLLSDNKSSLQHQQQIEEMQKQLLEVDKTPKRDDYTTDTFSPTVAKMTEFNPNLLLPKGTYIGCSLDTRFVSSIQGSTSCTISQNIYSSNGNVLLVERGSKLFGTFKGGNTSDGVSRYFVIWEEIRTPQHLRIPLFSGASDELGGSGLEGEIDHKWMMRFGASVLLSAVDDMFNVLAYKLTNSSSNNEIDTTENTRENAKSMSSIALEQFIGIKPTVYKQHGDLVGAYVNRDIDFSKVYKLKKKI